MPPELLMMLMQQGQQLQAGLGQFLGGMFGDSGAPYQDAMNQLKKYGMQATSYQQPFYEAGRSAIPGLQDWLTQQKNPSGFINNLMNSYQESPYAKYLQQQAMRAGTNAASMGGLPGGLGGAGIGSTPFAQQLQQNAANISSQDMQNWLTNVLGINTQYGKGLEDLYSGGAASANTMTNMLSQLGQQMGAGAYGRRAGEQQDRANVIGGLMKMFL